ncbi:MAG: type II secretion system protein [Patescibacteria group bacterium]|nr:type II secretion system protein [Patescibacteria group bacterium]
MICDKYYKNIFSKAGQSLIEVIIGLAIGALIIGGATFAIFATLTTSASLQKAQSALALSQELLDKIRLVAGSNWNEIYNVPNKGTTSTYHVVVSGTILIVATGTQSRIIDGVEYTRYFSVENVNRGAFDNIVTSGGTNDPSTQKISVSTEWLGQGKIGVVKLVDYVTRWKNAFFRQTDWSVGPGISTPLNEPSNNFSTSTNIDFSEVGSIKLKGF